MRMNVTCAALAVLWVSSPALALEAAPAPVVIAPTGNPLLGSAGKGPAPASLATPGSKVSESCLEKSCPEKDALSREAAKALIDIFRLALAGGGSEAAAVMK